MKPKHFATIILTSLLIATVFGSVTVFAPLPSTPNPPTLFDTFITNTGDDPVPVDITDDSIDVNLDEPLDVTLDEPIDVNLDEPIEVTNPSGESLEVAVPDGVEITNTEGIPADVSGWLHTTKSGDEHMVDVDPFYMTLAYVETKGYRLLAIRLAVWGGDCTFLLRWYAGGYAMAEETITITAAHEDYRTYDVIGETLHIQVKSPDNAENADLYYYLTT